MDENKLKHEGLPEIVMLQFFTLSVVCRNEHSLGLDHSQAVVVPLSMGTEHTQTFSHVVLVFSAILFNVLLHLRGL